MPHITLRLTQDLIADEAKKALAGATMMPAGGRQQTQQTQQVPPGGRQQHQTRQERNPDKRNSPVPLTNVTIFIV